jgi:hypothetical protein
VEQGEVVVAEVTVGSRQLMKRYTLCKVADHDWKKVAYPAAKEAATSSAA